MHWIELNSKNLAWIFHVHLTNHIDIKQLSNFIRPHSQRVLSIYSRSQTRKGKMENSNIFVQLQFKLKINPADQLKIVLDRSRGKKFNEPDDSLSALRDAKTNEWWIVLRSQERKASCFSDQLTTLIYLFCEYICSHWKAGLTIFFQTFLFEVTSAPTYCNTYSQLPLELLNLIHL